MAIMNTAGAPSGELKATIVVIHPTKPEQCPDCGFPLETPAKTADGAPSNTVAFRCSGIGHRIHVFTGAQQ